MPLSCLPDIGSPLRVSVMHAVSMSVVISNKLDVTTASVAPVRLLTYQSFFRNIVITTLATNVTTSEFTLPSVRAAETAQESIHVQMACK